MEARSARGRAYARAALVGNPSDGYGGAVLAVTLLDFAADVTAEPATETHIEGPRELTEAALVRFHRRPGIHPAPVAVRCRSTIPERVGLGGSSAIVIAVLRALFRLHGIAPNDDELATLAWEAETEELGIAAGPQDRFAQAYGGLVLMDFAGAPRVERLDCGLLPPLFVAYRADAAESSDVLHAALRDRAGEPAAVAAMGELAALAHEAGAVLARGDGDRLGALMNRTLELRRRIIDLDPRHLRMVEIAHAHGAAANYAGSGGAIVGLRPGENGWPALRAGLQAEGCGVVELRPVS